MTVREQAVAYCCTFGTSEKEAKAIVDRVIAKLTAEVARGCWDDPVIDTQSLLMFGVLASLFIDKDARTFLEGSRAQA